MMLREAARLDPTTVQLWNGEKWTRVLGWSRTARNADELEIVLRSGERIHCTPTHQFPTSRGLLRAREIAVGDTLHCAPLPEPENPKQPSYVGDDAAWFAGLYLAAGSMSGDTIQIAGNASQADRYEKVCRIASAYGGSATVTIDGDTQSIRVYGKLLVAIVRELVSGRTAKDKGLARVCWRYGNDFLRAYLDGYLSGDGHYDEGTRRWRLCFTRNYNLERDLRTLAARLGFHLVLRPVLVDGFGSKWPAFQGEIRFERSGPHNEKNTCEVVEIRRSRCREVYDVGVEDAPHLFALASGVLTHSSKPNPLPESVEDRCTKAHEYVFMLAKSPRYYFDSFANKEPVVRGAAGSRFDRGKTAARDGGDRTQPGYRDGGAYNPRAAQQRIDATGGVISEGTQCSTLGSSNGTRNRRSVWTIPTRSYRGAHFATYPPDLIRPMVLVSTSDAGCCAACGAPRRRVVEKPVMRAVAPSDIDRYGNGQAGVHRRVGQAYQDWRDANPDRSAGWEPTCACGASAVPCRVLDPFAGSGTTLSVAVSAGRHAAGIELNDGYADLVCERVLKETGVLLVVQR